MLPEEPPARKYRSLPGGAAKKEKHFVHPMLARLHDAPFDSDEWLFEIKWDGYRAIAETGKKQTKLYSRNGLSFANAYPEVFDELQKIKRDLVLDGEIVALDAQGRPQFQLLQQYGQNEASALCYYIFDILKLDGKSLEQLPLTERKEILKEVLPESDIVRYCDHIEGRGKEFFRLVKKQRLEGMIAKRAGSTYDEGSRSADWLKVKNVLTEEALIAGYTAPRGGRKYFGALVLGIYKGKKFTYVGHTGTGFTDKILKDLYDKMQPLVTDVSPFDKEVPVNGKVTWLRPELVCNLKYTEITENGTRRHPVFTGLRVDKAASEAKDELGQLSKNKHMKKQDTPKREPTLRGAKKVAFTNLDKIFWPEEGFTKGDVINYYNAVYKYIIPYLKNRPESLFRTPNGINGMGFFQKDAGLQAPGWVQSEALYSESAEKDINYIICNDKLTLLYLANLGCIEMNPWNSRLGSLDNPDYLVLDLDPSDHNTFEQVIETAKVIKTILDKAGATSFPKTSGATGIHIYVPLGAKYTYDEAKEFAHMVAILANEQLPDITSLERSLSKRGKDRIYIDYLQNRKGQTLSCAYSLRPKPGASVSTPLEWKEVRKGLHPTNFTMQNIVERIEKKGDLFKGVMGKGIDMMKCLKKLDE